MNIKILPFLTQNDKTVDNALEIFTNNKNAPVQFWGFKDTGIEFDQAKILFEEIKKAGKTAIFESLADSEEKGLKATRFAVELKCKYLIGMEYFESVHQLLKKHNIKYFPTCGERSGIPRMLHGSIDNVVKDGIRIQNMGVDGLCLSMYRFTGGEPEALAEKFIREIKVPVIIAGSINNEQRLKVMKKINPWGFTIGSAFFNNDFGEGLSFGEQIQKVVAFMGN